MSSIQKKLMERCGSKCELCGNENGLQLYNLPPNSIESHENSIVACAICTNQINNPETTNPSHWRCLSDSMWNENIAVQLVAWRMLTRLRSEGWSQDLLGMMYFDEETLAKAAATGEGDEKEVKTIHRDANGTVLLNGDSVVLVKDLEVKGANFTGKRGAAVHNIKLVWNNANQFEGRLENQNVVILTQFVKKTK